MAVGSNKSGSVKKSRAGNRRKSSSSGSRSPSNKNHPKKKKRVWMDWLEQGVDLFCEESCANQGILRGALLQSDTQTSSSPASRVGPQKDFAALHDEFLESLLFEQSKKLTDSNSFDEFSAGVSSASSSLLDAVLDEPIRKRRRPIRLPGSRPKSHNSKQLVRSSSSSLSLSHTHYNPPDTYVHPHCRLQKDKHKGEPAGSCICAKGRDACLSKLRAKLLVLIQHDHYDIKRRPAIAWDDTEKFVETRSLLELRMGFVSLAYGVLLRWDASGLVTLVVLRKLCHESFYYPSKTPKSIAPEAPRSMWVRRVHVSMECVLQLVCDQDHETLPMEQSGDGFVCTKLIKTEPKSRCELRLYEARRRKKRVLLHVVPLSMSATEWTTSTVELKDCTISWEWQCTEKSAPFQPVLERRRGETSFTPEPDYQATSGWEWICCGVC